MINLEYLEQLVKALEAGNHVHTASGEDLDRMANEHGLTGRPASCAHEWVEYQGLRECYSYCKKCDEKAISDKK